MVVEYQPVVEAEKYGVLAWTGQRTPDQRVIDVFARHAGSLHGQTAVCPLDLVARGMNDARHTLRRHDDREKGEDVDQGLEELRHVMAPVWKPRTAGRWYRCPGRRSIP